MADDVVSRKATPRYYWHVKARGWADVALTLRSKGDYHAIVCRACNIAASLEAIMSICHLFGPGENGEGNRRAGEQAPSQ